ncbi:hypothetical protein GGQ80_002069 [Sphingomonas jinjuensis]|uniref:Uncharacterized protein n=1 Tax=Sphingomonas jinjuensis TaxID=535907 RepID=A0A840F8Y2_9SPHN|nr:hypothetical protein [Sphingomonas jinjuensis]
MPATEKVVLAALADCADDDGITWIAVKSLRGKIDLITMTSLGERTIQGAIKSLCAAGHLARIEQPGRGCTYTVQPRSSCGAQDMRGAPDAEAPAPAAGEPSITPQSPSKATPSTEARPKRVTRKPMSPGAPATPEERITGQRGRRIDIDWQPAKPLPDAIAKVVDGWPPGRLAEEVAEFRDFWISEAGQRASKLDWDATWWNRLRELIKRDDRRAESENRRHGKRGRNDRGSGWAARPGMEGAEPAFLPD